MLSGACGCCGNRRVWPPLAPCSSPGDPVHGGVLCGGAAVPTGPWPSKGVAVGHEGTSPRMLLSPLMFYGVALFAFQLLRPQNRHAHSP
jgi:hypothetical protein